MRKEIPSITHEEFEAMSIEKMMFFFGILDTIKEQEEKSINNKPHNIGRSKL